MKGKKRCKILKEIRRQIAQNNDIEYVTSECKHKGDCLGTCPKCEEEVRYLERELEKRQKLGRTIAVAGLSVALMTSTVGCDDWFDGIGPTGGKPLAPEEEELGGKDVPVPDQDKDDVELGGKPMPPEEDEPTAGEPLDEWDGEIAPPDEDEEDEDVELGGDPLPPEETMGDIP